MGRSRPMREANYKSNSYSKNKVKCEEVTTRMTNIGTFHCTDCGVRLIYAGGTRPYFRLSKNTSHNENCDNYLPVDDIAERVREVGEKLQVKLAPPNFHKEEITQENNLKDNIMKASSEKKTVKVGPVKTIKNSNKTTNYTFSSVERLFFAISNERPEKTRKIMLSKLLSNNQLYFANRYNDLIKDYEDDKLNRFFFVMGYLHQKEYFNFKENGYIDIQDERYNYGSIELRVHIKGISVLEKRFKNISWYIKSGPNKTAYIGVMGEVLGIETTENKMYLNIKCYDLDIEYLQNHE
ncbi:hypothetical protein [Bacillus pseudomycoides]|uniref:hypothetical protein n=1 Tax=Bacillus pseudomycoides TaxID=64104 RepID=UPI0015CF680F|nr:hypothetical protein [Bacillus pseudomycoides]